MDNDTVSREHEFIHLLLTRFNLNLLGDSAPDRTWLSHRFTLFEQFCYPSVRSQSCQQFKWLVFFDKETPKEWRVRIKEYEEYSNFQTVYLECYDLPSICQILGTIVQDYEYVITTRLDNDDAVAQDFVNQIQAQFVHKQMEFINFTNGFVWHQRKVYLTSDSSNPFTSLIERVDGMQTIWCGKHGNLSEHGPIRQVEAAPLWLQVIHERNIINTVHGERQPICSLGNRFDIDPDLIPGRDNLLSYAIDKAIFRGKKAKHQIARRLKRIVGN